MASAGTASGASAALQAKATTKTGWSCLMQSMKKKKLTDEDKALKRQLDEIHPHQGEQPFVIVRHLLGNFKDPPSFHLEALDFDHSTLRAGTDCITDVIDGLQDQLDAIDEVETGFTQSAEEEVQLAAQHKFLSDVVTILGLIFPPTESWINLQRYKAEAARRHHELEALREKEPELFDAVECHIDTLIDLVAASVKRVDATTLDYERKHAEYLVATLPQVKRSKLARKRLGRKYDNMRKKLKPAPLVLSGSVLAKALSCDDLVAEGLVAKVVDGQQRAHCEPCNKTFHQCILSALKAHFLGVKATGKQTRTPSKSHAKKASAW